MTRKIDPADINHAIKLYKTGLTVKECAAITGLTDAVIHKRVAPFAKARRKAGEKAAQKAIDLISNQSVETTEACQICSITKHALYGYCRRSGISLPTKHDRALATIDTTQIIPLHESGVGAAGIASRLGTSPETIRKFLRDRGHKPRNRSEQQYARMAKMTPAEVAKFTENAHKAARGRKATREERIKRAKTLEGHHCPQSKWEPIVFDLISKDFPHAIPSKAFDIYNFDIGIGNSIAVEIFGGGWACTDKRRINHYLERTKEIGKFGIHTIFVVVSPSCDIGNADELIRTINFASGLPSGFGQYWVIWGDRQGASGSSFNIDKDAFIRPFISIKDRRTGRYVSIPR